MLAMTLHRVGLGFPLRLDGLGQIVSAGCEPGFTNVAACNSGSGENATATAKAKPAISVFLMLISRNLRFRYMRTACYRDCSAGRRRKAPSPCALA
jgi:hypothetical protein